MKKVLKRLKKWEKGEHVGPYSIQLNPTNRCNLECRFCWQRTNNEINFDEVSDERYLDLIDEAKALGVEIVEITGGGEPLIRKELIMRLVKKIKNSGLTGKLITNGTSLEKNDLLDFVQHEWDEIIFSVDGPEEVHDYLRGKDNCYKKTIQSMNVLNDIKNNMGSDKPFTTLHMVLCNKNHDKIEETIQIANDTGCDNFFVEPVVTLAFDTSIGKELKLSEKSIQRTLGRLERAKETANDLNLNHNLDSLKEELISKTNEMDEVLKDDVSDNDFEFDDSLRNAICFEPWHNLIIRSPGMVGPCCMFDNDGPNISENSLEEIWFGERFNEIRQALLNHELLSFCSKCNPSQVADNRKLRDML